MHAPHGPTADRAEGRPSPSRLTLRRGGRHAGDAQQASGTADASRRPATRSPADLVDSTDEPGEIDWRAIGVFGAGLALGALVGATTALLLAPSSGFETRMRLARGAKRAGERASDRWDDLESDLRSRARRSRRNLQRKLTLARWNAQDAWERKRYGTA